MEFLDLFSGIGAFRFGLKAHGFNCKGFCEIDGYTRNVYKAIHNTEGEIEMHDITKVHDSEWEKFKGIDIITGGAPCQAFSLLGKREGFEDARGTLFFEMANVARITNAPILIMENVEALLSHNKGKTIEAILKPFTEELGYVVEYGILNSKYWGVPQNRKRLFIIAVKKELYKESILQPLIEMQTETSVKLKDILESDVVEKYYIKGETINKVIHHSNEDSLAIHEDTALGFKIAEPFDGIYINRPYQKRGTVQKEMTPTINTSATDIGVVTEDLRVRRITPKEAWRLQKLPDWACDRAISIAGRTRAFKMAGNSITVSVVEAIGERIKMLYGEENNRDSIDKNQYNLLTDEHFHGIILT